MSPIVFGAIIAIVSGAALRCIEVAQGHTFAFDDTMLAINIASHSVRRLAEPLAYEQTAPVLFLWIDRWLVDLAGVNAVVLRLLPLIGGIAVLPLTWSVGRRLVPGPAAVLAVAILAVSPLAVDYTDRTKPYIVDAAVALGLIVLTLQTIDAPDRRRSWMMLTVGAIIAPVLSTPAVFTLAACAAALLVARVPGKSDDARHARSLSIAVWIAVWMVVALANYLVFQRAPSHDPYLQRYWERAYFTRAAPGLLARVREVTSSFIESLFYGGSVRPPIAFRITAALLAIVGAGQTARRAGVGALILLTGPLVLAVLAAAARVYPPSDRTWLFAAPSVALLAAAGLYLVCAQLPAAFRRPVFIVIGLAALYFPARQSVLAFRGSLAPDDLEAGIHAWEVGARPTDPIYVFSRDAIRWTYYTTDWGHPDVARLHWLMAAAAEIGPNSGNVPSRGHAVDREGDALVYRGAQRAELIGIPTGMEDLVSTPPAPRPDVGWADNEARRLAVAANPTIWMFFLYCKPQVDSLVIAAAERRGARLTETERFDGVRLYRLEFDRAPTS